MSLTARRSSARKTTQSVAKKLETREHVKTGRAKTGRAKTAHSVAKKLETPWNTARTP
jgi:hypothetical protein